jgi:nucleoside-triphosphatase THEP1
MTPHEIISLKIAELYDAVQQTLPSMPTLLRTIHANLKTDPELVTLLTTDEVAIIVSGLSKQTQTTITTQVLSGGKGKSMKKISVDDI